MKKEVLKNALFGYSKISVCQYIATMNEEFNANLLAETEAFRQERSQMQQKIAEQETELAGYKQNACEVGNMLLEAGQYAAQVRQQAEEEAAEILRQAREEAEQIRIQTQNETERILQEIKEKGEAQTQKIELYAGAIAKLREDMALLANQTDDALNALGEQFQSLRQDFEDSES